MIKGRGVRVIGHTVMELQQASILSCVHYLTRRWDSPDTRSTHTDSVQCLFTHSVAMDAFAGVGSFRS